MDDKDREMYELVCKRRLDSIDTKQDEMLRLLRGRNSEPGLIDDVRGLKKAYKAMVGTVVFIASVLVIQGIRWLWNLIGK